MADRPIIFSAPMVRAILAGTKTQTRRAIKAQPNATHDGEPYWFIGGYRVWGYRPATAVPLRAGGNPMPCPYGQPGDRLWVRETFVQGWPHNENGCPDQFDEDGNERPMSTWYRASNPELIWCTDGENDERTPWRPSIHMPRWASRITLEITAVRVDRLQDISEADAQAEGIQYSERFNGYCIGMAEHFHSNDPRQSYLSLWEAINGGGSVEANPWVWVLEFKRAANQEPSHG